MARVIAFCKSQVYQALTTYSEIFDVTDIAQLDAELMVTAVSGLGGGSSWTGYIETTSDPTLSTWRDPAVIAWSGTTAITKTGTFSGLGQFARARIVLPANSYITACLNAVGRER
jgi:hypothetical protein